MNVWRPENLALTVPKWNFAKAGGVIPFYHTSRTSVFPLSLDTSIYTNLNNQILLLVASRSVCIFYRRFRCAFDAPRIYYQRFRQPTIYEISNPGRKIISATLSCAPTIGRTRKSSNYLKLVYTLNLGQFMLNRIVTISTSEIMNSTSACNISWSTFRHGHELPKERLC